MAVWRNEMKLPYLVTSCYARCTNTTLYPLLTNSASIDLIFVLCSPTELTNTSVGPTQYFIPFGPTQSNKYKHFRQFFLNYTKLPISASVVWQIKNAQELDQKCPWDILSTKQTVSPMKCSVTQVSSGSKGEQGEGLGKFTFCQVPTTHGPCDMVAVLMRGAGGYSQTWKYGAWTKIQSNQVASGFFSSNCQALYLWGSFIGAKDVKRWVLSYAPNFPYCICCICLVLHKTNTKPQK